MSVQNLKYSEEFLDEDQRRNGRDGKKVKQWDDFPELERMLPEEFDKLYELTPISDDTSCGFWFLRGKFVQKFANKKVYVCLYGLIGCIFAATYAYFNGTITTLEKRYKIPSKNTGIISIGNDISQLLLSTLLSYYAGKGHRPRWMAFGLMTIVLFCILTAFPHLLYGPGQDALGLTFEYGATFDGNATLEILEQEKIKTLCRTDTTSGLAVCESGEGNFAPQVVLFLAQFVSGIGGPLYYSLGVSYMDDNIQKSKTPALVSLSYFLRMLGPAIGYATASFCLKFYIAPTLTPSITNSDPRWLGAWWMGWIVFGSIIFIFAILIGMFPKTLHRAAVRKVIQKEKVRRGISKDYTEEDKPASLKDLVDTFKRLSTNKIFMCNNIAAIFYFFGYVPYWTFTPKYIETQYRQSSSVASLVTGTVALAFSAIGILISGVVISKFKPRARYLAAWNVLVGVVSVAGMISYVFLGCDANDHSLVMNIPVPGDTTTTCNSNCHCDYVKYSPICGEDGKTYISPCHAGCKVMENPDGQKIFEDCSCISKQLGGDNYTYSNVSIELPKVLQDGGSAKPGSCVVDCMHQFVSFLAVMCALKFMGATGRSSNFLVSVRCVSEKDKPVSMGYAMTLMSLLAFIPSPIFFGALFDKTCLVWGKTCTGTGNCWLYDGESMRYMLNVIAAGFCVIGTLFDAGVWYYVKDLQIFDEEDLEVVDADVKAAAEMTVISNSEEQITQKKPEEK